jgi:hypothetical protein
LNGFNRRLRTSPQPLAIDVQNINTVPYQPLPTRSSTSQDHYLVQLDLNVAHHFVVRPRGSSWASAARRIFKDTDRDPRVVK